MSSIDKNIIIPSAPPINLAATPIIVNAVPFKENRYDEMVIYGIVLIIVIIFIIICSVAISYISSLSTQATNSDNNTTITINDENIGALINNNIILPKPNSEFGFLDNPDCQGDNYGRNCEFQSHDPNYYNIGNVTGNYQVLPIETDSLSFINGIKSHNSATFLANKTKGCTGVTYDHVTKKANLITSNITATGNANFDFSKHELVYLKKKIKPHFIDKVFGLSNQQHLRYYFDNSNKNDVVKIELNKMIELNWIPNKIVNYTGAVGHYYTSSNKSKAVYIDSTQGEHNLPVTLLAYNTLWVEYVILQQ